MSDEHKAALAEGRSQSKAVRQYLEALEAHKPKRGRKRTAETVKARLAKIDAEMRDADALSMLNLRQERLDLQNELSTMSQKSDLRALEADFIKAAKGYSQRKGITYAAWREVGVPAATLKAAGIARAS